MLHDIVARYTDMPVHVAAHGMQVEKDNIYVMPADAILDIGNRQLLLRQNTSCRERKPIDIFLNALAADIGELSGGIILSGGDGDGTLGIKAVKHRGGITLAQVGDGFGPQHPDMPDSAISSGLVDFAVPVEEMGAKLADFVRGGALLGELLANAESDGDDSSINKDTPETNGMPRNQTGHNFGGYKAKTFMRRVQRRMQVTRLRTMEAYVERLRQEPQEVGALFRDLLINVTSFFRDEEAFEAFEGRRSEAFRGAWRGRYCARVGARLRYRGGSVLDRDPDPRIYGGAYGRSAGADICDGYRRTRTGCGAVGAVSGGLARRRLC
jgi:two-component system CheB/CheR fusion protein